VSALKNAKISRPNGMNGILASASLSLPYSDEKYPGIRVTGTGRSALIRKSTVLMSLDMLE